MVHCEENYPALNSVSLLPQKKFWYKFRPIRTLGWVLTNGISIAWVPEGFAPQFQPIKTLGFSPPRSARSPTSTVSNKFKKPRKMLIYFLSWILNSLFFFVLNYKIISLKLIFLLSVFPDQIWSLPNSKIFKLKNELWIVDNILYLDRITNWYLPETTIYLK